jgi:hypothetical protein
MPKKDHKAQKAKARKEALRKQKAGASAQPRAFRQEPELAAALSTRHPLVGYFVNPGWAEARMAAIHVVREAESGQVFAGFLVDIAWRGTKDAYGNYGAIDAIAELQHHRPQEVERIDPATAVNLIRGGVAWARRWRYPLPTDLNMWLRLVDPLPAGGPDLTVFGENGEKPIILGTLEEVARYEGLDLRDLEIVDDEDDEIEGEDDNDELEVIDAQPQPSGLWVPGQPEPESEAPRKSRLWLPWQRDEQ